MKQNTFSAVVAPIIWNLLSVVLGALMIAYSGQVIYFGLLFLGIYLALFGLLPILKALFTHNPLPFHGILSLVCGVLLIIFNATLTGIVFVLLGLLLFLIGLQQLNNFLTMRRRGLQLRWYYYLYPVLAIAAGVIAVCNPFEAQDTLVSFVGWCLVIHGLISVVGVIAALFRRQPEVVVATSAEAADATDAEAEEVNAANGSVAAAGETPGNPSADVSGAGANNSTNGTTTGANNNPSTGASNA